LGFVLPIPKKRNLYWQHAYQRKAWLLKPLHTLII
jgi:hypothetical protein